MDTLIKKLLEGKVDYATYKRNVETLLPHQPQLTYNPNAHNKALDEAEVLIMRAIWPPDCYSISVTFRKENLPVIRLALEPLGYTLRFPRR